MTPLHEVLAPRVASWAKEGYPSEAYPAVAEIFDWISDPDTGSPRFLRTPQIHALETYWYLRLIEGTPTVFDLYTRLYPGTVDRLDALGMGSPDITRWLVDHSLEELWARVREDEDFVRLHRLETVRETLALDYPSYIGVKPPPGRHWAVPRERMDEYAQQGRIVVSQDRHASVQALP